MIHTILIVGSNVVDTMYFSFQKNSFYCSRNIIHVNKITNVVTKPMNKGFVFGGIAFGLGWAITGACPGPIYAQIGSGTFLAVVTLLAALTGAYIFAILQPRLPF